MGIYDREYYRREGPSYLGSIINRGQVCKYLILANIAVFVIQLVTESPGKPFPESEGPFTSALWLMPLEVMNGAVWQLLSYSFLHAGILHILFNMLFLWWFGNEVEDLYGLTAVLVLYAFHYPSRIIYFWFIPMPVWLFVAILVGMDGFGFISTIKGSHSGTAVTVHLAGAAFAFTYYKLQWRVMSWLPDLRDWRKNQARRRSKLRVYREDEPERTPVAVAAPPSSSGEVDEQLEAKLDAVLQKVSQSGKDSLTDSERQILVRASEVYKKRRS